MCHVKILNYERPYPLKTIALHFFGSTAEYRTIANLFGVSTSFVCNVAKAIVAKLRCHFLSTPKGDELLEIIKLYKEK